MSFALNLEPESHKILCLYLSQNTSARKCQCNNASLSQLSSPIISLGLEIATIRYLYNKIKRYSLKMEDENILFDMADTLGSIGSDYTNFVVVDSLEYILVDDWQLAH